MVDYIGPPLYDPFYIALQFILIFTVIAIPIILLITWYKVEKKLVIGRMHRLLLLIFGLVTLFIGMLLLKEALFPGYLFRL